MGLLDSITSMVQGAEGGPQQGQVAGGVLQALDEHPGGLAGVFEHLKNNGMGEQAQTWAATGQPANPEDLHQGLQGSGLIENVAAKAGISPQMAEMAMAAILPMVMAHFTQNGQTAPPQSGLGGMASQILGRLL